MSYDYQDGQQDQAQQPADYGQQDQAQQPADYGQQGSSEPAAPQQQSYDPYAQQDYAQQDSYEPSPGPEQVDPAYGQPSVPEQPFAQQAPYGQQPAPEQQPYGQQQTPYGQQGDPYGYAQAGPSYQQPEQGLSTQQAPNIVESASATTSPDNVNSGNKAYIIAAVAALALTLLIMGCMSMFSAAFRLASHEVAQQGDSLVYPQGIPYSYNNNISHHGTDASLYLDEV